MVVGARFGIIGLEVGLGGCGGAIRAYAVFADVRIVTGICQNTTKLKVKAYKLNPNSMLKSDMEA